MGESSVTYFNSKEKKEKSCVQRFVKTSFEQSQE